LGHLSTIAIVDDDEPVREALGDLLIVSGFVSYTFDSAAAFLADRDVHDFDCLVTDIRMPAMSGLELIERLRAETAGLPVIILSSVLDDQIRLQARALGASACLSKPVADERLLDAINAAIDRDRPAQPER
jgi:two-component system response regulator FixJ